MEKYKSQAMVQQLTLYRKKRKRKTKQKTTDYNLIWFGYFEQIELLDQKQIKILHMCQII